MLTKWHASGTLSQYVSDALRRQKGTLRSRCCRKAVSGGITGVATADPSMPHDVIRVPHNWRLESDTAIVVRNPAMNHNSMQVISVKYHTDSCSIRVSPQTLDKQGGDADGDMITVISIGVGGSRAEYPRRSRSADVEPSDPRLTAALGCTRAPFAYADLVSCYTLDFNQCRLAKCIVTSGVVKVALLSNTPNLDFRSLVQRWPRQWLDAIESVRVLATSSTEQGIAGFAFRRIRLGLEPLMIKSDGTVTWLCEAIVATAQILDQDQRSVSISAGQLITSYLGVCAQQDLLDLHKLPLMSISPTSLALHFADDRTPNDIVIVMARPTRRHSHTADTYDATFQVYMIEPPENMMSPECVSNGISNWMMLQTGARLAIMSAKSARQLVVGMSSMAANVTRWICTPALRTCPQPQLSVQPPWYTFASTEFMCRSNVADSCIDCIRIAVEAGHITTDVDHNGCSTLQCAIGL